MGHAGVSELAPAMKLEWSDQALADLDRFAEFLHREHPSLAPIVAAEIIGKAQVLSEQPQLGRPISDCQEYRQIVLQVAAYVFQYRFDGQRLVMLRVFHGRETRE
jgi:toxin ParE1/3/4